MRTEQLVSQALKTTNDDRYLLTAAISKRVRQIQNGADPLVECDIKNEKIADIAIREFAEGLLEISQDD
jgi:DNA-directed RNA polymerase subunit omega